MSDSTVRTAAIKCAEALERAARTAEEPKAHSLRLRAQHLRNYARQFPLIRDFGSPNLVVQPLTYRESARKAKTEEL